MKKKILTMTLTALMLFPLFASGNTQKNHQKIWEVNSTPYKNLTYLFLQEKKSMPNSTGPWSTDELLKMYETLDGVYDNKTLQDLYFKTYSLLTTPSRFKTADDFCFDVNGIFSPEFYIHSNSTDFKENKDWFYDYHQRKDLLNFVTQAYISDCIYGYVNADLSYACYEDNPLLYKNNIISNIPFITGIPFALVSTNFPRRSVISFGGEHWSLSGGKDVLRWGCGETGNLLLGGNQKYDTSIRFSAYYNTFKYTFASIFYPHIGEVNLANREQDAAAFKGLNLYLSHRFDFKFFNDRLNFTMTESVMYQNTDGGIDFRIFNPAELYHSLFIRGNANSIMSLESDYTAFTGFNIYSQVVIDEFSFIGESNGTDNEKWRPSKIGYLAGIRYTMPLYKGFLKLNLEGVYTDPYLYLREAYNTGTGQYGVSFYGNIREFQNLNGISYIRRCIGYKYGGDCIVGDLKASYYIPEISTNQVELFYMAHGVMYNDLGVEDFITGQKTHTPSTFDQTRGNNKAGVPEHILRLSLSSSYKILSWLDIYGGIDNIFIWNKSHITGSMVYDMQIYTGATLTL